MTIPVHALLVRVGSRARDNVMEACQTFAVLGAALVAAAQPRHWPRTVRSVFARQLLFTGVGAVHFTCAMAALAGILVVVQADRWFGRVGLSEMAAPLLVTVLVRELGPLLGNMMVILNSGSAITTELGLMKVHGEVRVLEAQGIEPLPYLVMPRVLATSIATSCLTVVFILVAFASGYVFGSLMGSIRVDAGTFAVDFLRALRPVDVLNVVIKGLVPGLLTGVICTTRGLNAGPSLTRIPVACRRALVRSLGALFLSSSITSILTYV